MPGFYAVHFGSSLETCWLSRCSSPRYSVQITLGRLWSSKPSSNLIGNDKDSDVQKSWEEASVHLQQCSDITCDL